MTNHVSARLTTIAFEDGTLEQRNRSGAHNASGEDEPHRRRRSASRDSISSVRSRIQHANYDIPITYRTLSFQTSESKAISELGGEDKGKEDLRTPGHELAHADHHRISVERLCQRLGVSPTVGLSSDSAAKHLQEHGYNVLPQRRRNYAKTLAGYVFGGFCSILWVGVIIFFICWKPLGDPDPQPYNLGLAVLVIIVIILQASFSAFQDWSTAKTMNSILGMLPSDALVLRDGHRKSVPTKEVVVGDIVHLEIGNKVPADIRLIKTIGDTRFDRSAMTGESEEVEASLDPTDDNILESRNMALMGTVVTNGTATGIVIFTGAKTVMGAIAKATSAVKAKPTAIQQEITRFVTIICGLTICLACLILFAWVGWLRIQHHSFMNVVAMLDDIMGCVVAFIPEGMPVGVALTLMLIARRMKAVNVLPKSLATVETLGCVSVICSDKTGTLTKNQMTVTSISFVDESMSSQQAKERFSRSPPAQSLVRLMTAAGLCNGASFDPVCLEKPIEDRLTHGNPTDGALLRFVEAVTSSQRLRHLFPQVAAIPFNPKNKFMLTLHQTLPDEANPAGKAPSMAYTAFLKGGPDVLLPRCSQYWSFQSNSVADLDGEARTAFSELQNRMSRNAERVILLCERKYTPTNPIHSNELSQELVDHCATGLVAIGLVGIFDPPRPETASTVAACRRAGIRFFMMTGDFGLTGAAIARQVGIFTGDREPDTFSTIEERRDEGPDTEYSNQSLLLEGSQISQLEKDDWNVVCAYQEIVFGRCTPEHKLRIVNELRSRGNTTAVTGDGVNDAPALKAADVGVAMVNGSDVALEAAHLVLLDKFDSIVDGIRLGRLVFQNLQKVISYLLPAGSWSEIWPVLVNVFFGVPLPLSSFLMIIICVFTDLFLALSLIMEREEFDLLSLPPRNRKKDHLINLRIYAQSYLFIGVMETICAHAMYFLYYYRYARIPIKDLFFAFEKYSAGFHGYTEAELTAFNTTGQSVYFITLVFLQWGNILSIRNKRLSILQADPIRKQRRNPWLLLSAVLSIAVAIFVTQEPGIQSLFGTGSAPIEFWFLPLPLALGILMMDELRKLCVRTWPRGPLARIAW
ncbi:sodium/potassium-transporting ATPase subunit alpha [Cladophialophora psammophila CBS 110553]|uniref:Sodium/potassium-transporting ATPase subunit alpha n=1 Tax=Cladophialophora psammophila CBS 110553 TaxID=1182543 RepID=W9XH40_9EURO|nr:sodium/potassium-transporting ATPase subunit alpha [Cladophialophora psammophila CBS 110553]EXJ76660.1 sodium/potassium-transporting ATPase subunit alpha [Cladophialophora psammophila CBS 110553]